jgi:CheY-like chemotaxis protein/tRNA A-37 threonylcarbamoyl transferase component Bud32
MSERRDRLEPMIAREDVAESQATRALARGAAGRRLLLYAPPPALAKHYLALLEGEGWEVMLATEPAAVELLLTTWPPQLVVAVLPLLPAELRERWRTLAPEADVRWAAGLSELIDLQVLPPRDLLAFTVKALAAVCGTALPAGGADVALVLRLASAAAEELGFGDRDLATVQLEAALCRFPELLTGDGRGGPDTLETTERSERRADRKLLAELGAATLCPLPLGLDRPRDGSGPAVPLPGEIVEAAARLAQLLAQGEKSPEVALRRLAREGAHVAGMLHPTAVEAVLVAHGTRRVGRGRLLLVDPDAGARNLLALRLRNEGYEVRAVGDGRLALEEIRRDAPALVLAEAVLPRLDGFALLDAMAREGRGATPLVFLSARGDAMSINKGLLLGAADYLTKPVNVEVLLTKLQRLLAASVDSGEASARFSLSDFAVAGTDELPLVSYEQLAPGAAILGRFRLVKALGEGGMGKVFRARDERLDEDVVVKVMKPQLSHDPTVLERFKREIRLARRITHPHVVRIFDFWEAGQLKFLTMEYLEGSNLRVELQRRGAFPLPVTLRIADELLQALAAAHAVGVVHRDVKPHNVVMLPNGHVKVLDFGIAQALESADRDGAGVGAGVVAGTFEYMSPEQVAGEGLDPRSDLYSAGLVIWELLTGEPVFRGTDRAAVAQMRLTRNARPPSAVTARLPAAVDAFVLRLLSRDRDARPATAREAVDELARIRG